MSKVTCILLTFVFSTRASSHTDSKSRCKDPSLVSMKETIKSNKSTVVQCLIKKGFDVDTQDDCGWTALKCAQMKDYEVIISLLKKAGAK